MKNINLKDLTDEELDKFYKIQKWRYDREQKPLFKRKIGGILLSILREKQIRNEQRADETG